MENQRKPKGNDRKSVQNVRKVGFFLEKTKKIDKKKTPQNKRPQSALSPKRNGRGLSMDPKPGHNTETQPVSLKPKHSYETQPGLIPK